MLYFFYTKRVGKMGRERSPKRRVRDDDFILGSWSDCRGIVLLFVEKSDGFAAEILNSGLRGRRSFE